MHCEIHHLPFEGEASDVQAEIRFNDHGPTPEEFDDLWEKVGEDEVSVDTESQAINEVWERWNAGSKKESSAFARRECEDCNEVFTGERNGHVDLGRRQERAEEHERRTSAEGDGHNVERGTRSLSVGDIVVVEGRAFLCEPIGWSEVEVGGDD